METLDMDMRPNTNPAPNTTRHTTQEHTTQEHTTHDKTAYLASRVNAILDEIPAPMD
jgi:hypothetical protein